MGYEVTVDDPPFNAVGDGVTDDKPAFLAMAQATGGIIRMKAKAYNIGNLTLTGYTQVIIQGDGQPQPTADFSRLQGGSIMVGGVYIGANAAIVEDCGVDSGTGRGFTTGSNTDGLVVNAPTNATGNAVRICRVSSLGPGESGTTHGILLQGFTSAVVDGAYCAERDYGLVVKCHNASVSNVSGDNIQTALVFAKSDTPQYGGNVADATACNFSITNVNNRCSSSNTTSSAVYVNSSTATISKVAINTIYQQGGHSPVRLQGSGVLGGPSVGSVTCDTVVSDQPQYGFYAAGYTYDWQALGLVCSNPATGSLFSIDSPSMNWKVVNGSLLISNSAISSNVAGTANGSMGLFDNISVRNPYRNMLIVVATGASVSRGTLVGNVSVSG